MSEDNGNNLSHGAAGVESEIIKSAGGAMNSTEPRVGPSGGSGASDAPASKPE